MSSNGRRYHRFTPRELRLIPLLHDLGYSDAQIARWMGAAQSSVWKIRHGLIHRVLA